MSAVELQGVTKRYGDETAVADVDLAVPAGERLALVGHNGAGKTTLMKLMLGLCRPTAGAVNVLGANPLAADGAARRRNVGFLPENVVFQGAMTGREVMRFYARLKAVPVADTSAVLERVGLADAAGRRVTTYSKGMRQRLGLAQALIGHPEVLLLDEPTSGLDPTLRAGFYEILEELRAHGATIVLSSHVLTELEARTDRVAILNGGRLVACETLGELRRAADLPTRIRVAVPGGTAGALAERLGDAAAVRHVNDRAVELSCDGAAKMAVLRRLAALGHDVSDIEIAPPTLDEVYAHFSQGGRPR